MKKYQNDLATGYNFENAPPATKRPDLRKKQRTFFILKRPGGRDIVFDRRPSPYIQGPLDEVIEVKEVLK